MIKCILIFATINGALAIILGAFGAHGLRDDISAPLLAAYKTGVLYHLIHVLALLFLAIFMWVLRQQNMGLTIWLQASAYLWIAGIILFSGSLYGLALSVGSWLGPVTPLGGVLLISGWISLCVAVVRLSGSQSYV